jgi:hypothetical protein
MVFITYFFHPFKQTTLINKQTMCQEKYCSSIKEKILEKTVKTIGYLYNLLSTLGPISLANNG